MQFIPEGRGLCPVEGETFETGAGDVLAIKAGEVHSFRCIGDALLAQLDVHLSPTVIQENLDQAQGASLFLTRNAVNATEAVDYIREAFPGVESTEAYTCTFVFYGSVRMLPFATLATADNEHDRVCDLTVTVRTGSTWGEPRDVPLLAG